MPRRVAPSEGTSDSAGKGVVEALGAPEIRENRKRQLREREPEPLADQTVHDALVEAGLSARKPSSSARRWS